MESRLKEWWDEAIANQEKQIQRARMPESREDAQNWMEMLKYERARQEDSPSSTQEPESRVFSSMEPVTSSPSST